MKHAQGRRLIAALKRRALTYLEMQRLGISTCPQKRVVECLREGELIVKGQSRAGLTTWRVVEAAKN